MKKILSCFIYLFIFLAASSQNVGIGVNTPAQKLHVNGNVMIDSAKVLEFGGRLTKEVNAGKMGYAVFTPETLDIVGAGTSSSNRKIKFFNEGGATFSGNIHLQTSEITTAKTGANNNLIPMGYASVQSTGSKSGGTSNITTSFVTDHYVINLGESVTGSIPVITPLAGGTSPRFATYINGSTTELWVYIWNTAGAKVQNGFSIVIFKP